MEFRHVEQQTVYVQKLLLTFNTPRRVYLTVTGVKMKVDSTHDTHFYGKYIVNT